MARQAVEQELQGQNGRPGANGNGRRESSAPRATAAQLRAVRVIADRQRLDLPSFLREQYGAASADDLTLPQASRLIDELKARGVADESTTLCARQRSPTASKLATTCRFTIRSGE